MLPYGKLNSTTVKIMSKNDTITKESPGRRVGMIDEKHRVCWVSHMPPPKKREPVKMDRYWSKQLYDMFGGW